MGRGVFIGELKLWKIQITHHHHRVLVLLVLAQVLILVLLVRLRIILVLLVLILVLLVRLRIIHHLLLTQLITLRTQAQIAVLQNIQIVLCPTLSMTKWIQVKSRLIPQRIILLLICLISTGYTRLKKKMALLIYLILKVLMTKVSWKSI